MNCQKLIPPKLKLKHLTDLYQIPPMTNNDIVQKLWNLCDVLRDDGINYSDYVTELVLLLFIKMEYENTEAGLLDKHKLPEGCRWPDLNGKSGLNLLERIQTHPLASSQQAKRLLKIQKMKPKPSKKPSLPIL